MPEADVDGAVVRYSLPDTGIPMTAAAVDEQGLILAYGPEIYTADRQGGNFRQLANASRLSLREEKLDWNDPASLWREDASAD